MPQRQSWASQIEAFANQKRETESYGPAHPAVQMALRWHDRMIANGVTVKWRIGIGGACELRWRVFKQWVFEKSEPLRRVWDDPIKRNGLIVGCVVLFLVLGLLIAPKVAVSVASIPLAIVALVCGIAAGAVSAGVLMKRPGKYDSNVGRGAMIIGWVLGAPIALVVFLCGLVVKSRYWTTIKHVIRVIAITIALLIVATVFIAGIVGYIVTNGWVDLLVRVGAGLMLAGVCYLIWSGVVWLGRMLKKRAKARQLHREQLHREDPVAQAAAYQRLLPILQETYAQYVAYPTFRSRDVLEFDAWIEHLVSLMKPHGHAWSDLLIPDKLWTRFDYIGKDDFTRPIKYGLLRAVEVMLEADVKPSELRRQRRREFAKFMLSLWHLIKYWKVCPNVDLPDLEQVRAATLR